MGLITTMTLIFIVQKAAGLVAWSLVWVLCTVWLPAAVIGGTFLVILVAGRIKTGTW